MANEGLKYFIEHKVSRLWLVRIPDMSRPNYISTFRGDSLKFGHHFKDAWTNNPHGCFSWDSQAEAQKFIDLGYVDEPIENLEITEHIFTP